MHSDCYSGKLTFWARIFFFPNTFGMFKIGDNIVLFPPNDLVPVHTPTYLHAQYVLDTFWKLFIYITGHSIADYIYVTDWTNRENKC